MSQSPVHLSHPHCGAKCSVFTTLKMLNDDTEFCPRLSFAKDGVALLKMVIPAAIFSQVYLFSQRNSDYATLKKRKTLQNLRTAGGPRGVIRCPPRIHVASAPPTSTLFLLPLLLCAIRPSIVGVMNKTLLC